MNKFNIFIFSLICFVLTTGTLFAQVQAMEDFKQMREEIVKKQENTRTEIERLNSQIQKFEERFQLADQKYEALYSKYQDLKQLIALQDQKLSELQREQSQVEDEISVTIQSLEEKRRELEQLIKDYKKTLGYLYKHGRTSQLALIFSSSSINQMLVRAFYLEKFNDYREQQAKEIRETEKELEETKVQLEEAQSKNEKILAEIREEKQKLAEKKNQQEKNVALLRENREEIKNKLNEVQQQKEDLNNTLSKLIREEEKVRKAQEQRLQKLEEERKKKLAAAKKIENDAKRTEEIEKYSEPVKINNFMDSEKISEVEESFEQNKGNLPWPVESRTISEHFGNRRHPVYGTITRNYGIEIVTEQQASVRAVHEGQVIYIRPVPGHGDLIAVKHGRFITAYGNLSQIMVTEREIVQQGDVIGLAGDSESPRGESLFFLIRKDNENINPEEWLQMETISSKR
jgi:septal ring factor EnvC (AmiA/AmiB activator)